MRGPRVGRESLGWSTRKPPLTPQSCGPPHCRPPAPPVPCLHLARPSTQTWPAGRATRLLGSLLRLPVGLGESPHP